MSEKIIAIEAHRKRKKLPTMWVVNQLDRLEDLLFYFELRGFDAKTIIKIIRMKKKSLFKRLLKMLCL